MVCTQGSTQVNAISRVLSKNEDLFWRNIHFWKNPYLLRKFRAIFVRKNFVPRPPMALITSCFRAGSRPSEALSEIKLGDLFAKFFTIQMVSKCHT